jgi:hypothetical protein
VSLGATILEPRTFPSTPTNPRIASHTNSAHVSHYWPSVVIRRRVEGHDITGLLSLRYICYQFASLDMISDGDKQGTSTTTTTTTTTTNKITTATTTPSSQNPSESPRRRTSTLTTRNAIQNFRAAQSEPVPSLDNVAASNSAHPVPSPIDNNPADWTLDLPDTDHVRFFRSRDWPSTALGPLETWASALRLHTYTLFADTRPACLYWYDLGICAQSDKSLTNFMCAGALQKSLSTMSNGSS